MPLGRRLKVTPEKAVEMYREHKTTKKVAEILGISPTTVSNAIKKWEEMTGEQVLKSRGISPKYATPMTDRERSQRYRKRVKKIEDAIAHTSEEVTE